MDKSKTDPHTNNSQRAEMPSFSLPSYLFLGQVHLKKSSAEVNKSEIPCVFRVSRGKNGKTGCRKRNKPFQHSTMISTSQKEGKDGH